MITAKGVKQASQSQQSQPTREDYAETEQGKRSIVPLAFLLFLTGCAAYLKSFLSAKLEAREAEHAGKHDESDQSEPPSEDQVSIAPDEAAAEEDVAPGNGGTRYSSDNVIPISLFRESGDGVIVAPGSIQPAAPRPVSVATIPVEDLLRGNDNRARTASSSGDSGGSGGSGGGGGGGGTDRPFPHLPDSPLVPSPESIRNRAPRTNGPVHLQDVAGCQVLLISMLALLAGATDADGDRLSITNLSSTSGTLTRTDDGGWVFARDDGMLGEVTLTYTISDGTASVQQTAYFSVIEPPPIIGSTGDDNLLGTQCVDVIDGRAGNDNIDARGGNDIIFGGSGDDHIIAGAGNDTVHAGAGNDVVFAGLNNDIIFGGSGDDRLYGEDGNDTILGEDGNDLISGGLGDDIAVGGIGNDTLHGDAGNDALDGGEGDDSASGGVGNDVIVGAAGDDDLLGDEGNDVISDGAGRDNVHGGASDDHVVAAADAVDDTYDGGDGQDRLDYSTATLSITVDLGSGTAEGADVGRDMISAFEEIVTGSGDDHIVAGSTSVSMTGGGGNDTFEFQRPEEDEQAMTVRKITDFTVGDRIVAATYEIRYFDEDDVEDALSDMFEDIYLAEGDKRPVRFRFEDLDNDQRTLIDVHDRPDAEDFYTIEVVGHHQLHFTIVGT